MSDPESISGRGTPEPGPGLNRSETIPSRGGAARRRIFDTYDRVAESIEKENTYAYKNIDYHKEIRVLELYPGIRKFKNIIVCRLVTRPLFDENYSSDHDAVPIEYAALSYYWGDPKVKPRNRIYIFDTDQGYDAYVKNPVLISFAGIFHVQDNLFEALKQLRSPKEKENVYLWADAVCINQKNIKERTAQVTNMHEVYTHARDVYVWLGPGTNETHQTFTFLERILDLQELEFVVQKLTKRTDPNWSVDRDHCRRVIDLMKADWFGRRWIIQELALAANPFVLQGGSSMSWSEFADAIALFMTKYDQIRLAFQGPANYATSLVSDDHNIRALDARALGANALVTTTSDLFRRSKEGKIKRRLLNLETLVSSRLLAFEATDPKDTVFAILQIAKDTYSDEYPVQISNGLNTNSIIFRYITPVIGIALWSADFLTLLSVGTDSTYALDVAARTPAQNARIGVAVFISYCIKVLNLLFFWMIYVVVLDTANKVWIRIMSSSRSSVRQVVKVLDKRIAPKYQKCLRDVCADFIEYCIDTTEDKSKALDILCRHWAPRPKPEPFLPSQIEVEMPSWILPIEGHAFGAPKQARKNRINGDSFVGAERKGIYTACGNLGPEIKFGMTNAVQEVPEEGPSQEHGKYTMLPPTQGKEFPPRYDGTLEVKGFRLGEIARCEPTTGYIISRQALELCGWTREEGFTDLERCWRLLVANRGPDGSNPPSWYRRACKACLDQWYAKQNDPLFNTDTLKNHDGTPSAKVAFLDRVQKVIWDRKVICANTSGEKDKPLYGLAPPKSQVNDIICIFYGCSVPVAIRPVKETKPQEYIFLGECYIHEMMDGEAVEVMPPKQKEEWFKLQ